MLCTVLNFLQQGVLQRFSEIFFNKVLQKTPLGRIQRWIKRTKTDFCEAKPCPPPHARTHWVVCHEGDGGGGGVALQRRHGGKQFIEVGAGAAVESCLLSNSIGRGMVRWSTAHHMLKYTCICRKVCSPVSHNCNPKCSFSRK